MTSKLGGLKLFAEKRPDFKQTPMKGTRQSMDVYGGPAVLKLIDADWLSALNHDGFMFLEGLGAALLLPGVSPVAHGHDANFTCRGVET